MFLSLAISSQTDAQKSDYKSALGLKFYPGGITYKTFIKHNVAIEGVGYFWSMEAGLLHFISFMVI